MKLGSILTRLSDFGVWLTSKVMMNAGITPVISSQTDMEGLVTNAFAQTV